MTFLLYHSFISNFHIIHAKQSLFNAKIILEAHPETLVLQKHKTHVFVTWKSFNFSRKCNNFHMVKCNLVFSNVYWHLGVSCRFPEQSGLKDGCNASLIPSLLHHITSVCTFLNLNPYSFYTREKLQHFRNNAAKLLSLIERYQSILTYVAKHHKVGGA